MYWPYLGNCLHSSVVLGTIDKLYLCTLLFQEYERKKKGEEKVKKMADVEAHRAAVAAFMQRVREQVLARFQLAAHQKTLDQIVKEDTVPNIG